MSHDNNLVFRRDKLPKSLSLDSGFNPCVFRCLFSLTTKISNSTVALHNRLISAAGKCQVNRHTGIVITLRVCICCNPYTDTQCGWHCIPDINTFRLIKHRELILLHLFIIGLFDHEKVFIFFKLFHNTVID